MGQLEARLNGMARRASAARRQAQRRQAQLDRRAGLAGWGGGEAAGWGGRLDALLRTNVLEADARASSENPFAAEGGALWRPHAGLSAAGARGESAGAVRRLQAPLSSGVVRIPVTAAEVLGVTAVRLLAGGSTAAQSVVGGRGAGDWRGFAQQSAAGAAEDVKLEPNGQKEPPNEQHLGS